MYFNPCALFEFWMEWDNLTVIGFNTIVKKSHYEKKQITFNINTFHTL